MLDVTSHKLSITMSRSRRSTVLVDNNNMAHATSYGPQSNEFLSIDLSRALTRLERKILSSPLDPRLRHSSYERAKTSAVSTISPNAIGRVDTWRNPNFLESRICPYTPPSS